MMPTEHLPPRRSVADTPFFLMRLSPRRLPPPLPPRGLRFADIERTQLDIAGAITKIRLESNARTKGKVGPRGPLPCGKALTPPNKREGPYIIERTLAVIERRISVIGSNEALSRPREDV